MRRFLSSWLTIGMMCTAGHAIATTKVLVIADAASTNVADMQAQLMDSSEFEFEVDTILTTDIGSLDQLEEYDVLVTGDNGFSETHTEEVYLMMKQFFDNGGGVVLTGWGSWGVSNASAAAQGYVSEFLPVSPSYQYVESGTTITVVGEHEVFEGITEYVVSADYHEITLGALPADATALAITGDDEVNKAAAYREVEGGGKSFYLGGLYAGATGTYDTSGLRTGVEDQIFERAIAWAGGSKLSQNHNCILEESSVRCWGDNKAGQLGLGDTNSRGDDANEMGDNLPIVDLGSGFNVAKVELGGGSSCAVSTNGQVKCWGANTRGQLGQGNLNNIGDNPSEMGDNLPNVDLGTGFAVRDVAIGSEHVCALGTTGVVKCFGGNDKGQLGIGDVEDRGDNPGEMGANLLAVPLEDNAEAIYAGGWHTCAKLPGNRLTCWGYNQDGQLGVENTETRGDVSGEIGGIVELGTTAEIRKAELGDKHTCVLFDNAKVKCFGSNSVGELGSGDRARRGHASGTMGANLAFVDFGDNQLIEDLSCGGSSCCVLTIQGTLKCFGRNSRGQLGLGDTDNRGDEAGEVGSDLPFVNIGELLQAEAVFLGTNHSCVRLTTDGFKCWGDNTSGQLGQGHKASIGADMISTAAETPVIDL